MEVAYYDWGGAIDPNFDHFDVVVQKVHQACLDNPSCEAIELRTDVERQSQSIIVEFADGSFEADNPAGIHRVERLALTYSTDGDFRWEVRALRKRFPITIHQNHVLEGEPRSLCLYIEPWESVERTWTPQLFLKRIFWWLRATAEGTIHGDDQPIEHLFFTSPTHVLLPENHFESEYSVQKKLSFTPVILEEIKTETLIGHYCKSDHKNDVSFCVSVSVLLPPVENGPIEEYPFTLGQLQHILERRGSGVIEPLKDAFEGLVTENGIEFRQDKKEFVLLLLGIPRTRNGDIEKTDLQGFIVDSGVASLGEKLSVLFKAPGQNKWYRDALATMQNEDWKSLAIFPVNVKCYPTAKDIRRYSGLNPDDEGPNGIFAGVGALGGLIAQIWERECWGEWSYVDNDIVQAHNIVRHISSRNAIGYQKSIVVETIVNNIHLKGEGQASRSFVTSFVSDNPDLNTVIEQADILVDATTTLHVPRMISRKDKYPRTASVFITPSGMASVMLLEDKDRTIRCNSLEAQYYRAILDSEWGAEHLAGHIGRHWVGAGCREVTLSMSDELVHLHAATLSRQIRKSSHLPNARICVWEHQEDTGGIVPYEISVFPSQSVCINNWEIIWDRGFIERAKTFRSDALPNETGGILFGIVDQKDATITLVKACSAPENSESTPSSFGRAAYYSTDVLDGCHERTAGVVTYVGEWHSHPPSYGALPSKDDVGQLNFLTSSLQIEGMPALMMIIADSSVGFYLDKQGAIVKLDKLGVLHQR